MIFDTMNRIPVPCDWARIPGSFLREDEGAHAPVRHAEGLQGGQGGGVVGLVLDLGYQLAVQHLVVLVQHHHGAGG